MKADRGLDGKPVKKLAGIPVPVTAPSASRHELPRSKTSARGGRWPPRALGEAFFLELRAWPAMPGVGLDGKPPVATPLADPRPPEKGQRTT
jgi:hypothetical protein